MKSAYLYQFVNMAVGVLMIPMLLRYLESGQYLQWVLFTILGGFTLQIESSIQVLAVRRIARQVSSHQNDQLGLEVRRTQRAYRFLSLFVAIPFFIGGLIYLNHVKTADYSPTWWVEWSIFALAYAINYQFGPNNAVLLATDAKEISFYNCINSATRLINFSLSIVLIQTTLSLLGICISFLLTVILGCSVIAVRARRTLRSLSMIEPPNDEPPQAAAAYSPRDAFRYTGYTLVAFALYRGGILFATPLFQKSEVESFSLAVQALALLSTFALVPVQIWLPRFVKAIVAEDRSAIVRELTRTLLLANATYIAGVAALILLGPWLLEMIGASVDLPDSPRLTVAGLAMGVEVNIFVLINLLVVRTDYSFVKTYAASALAALACGLLWASLSKDLYALVFVPGGVQLLICLPLLFAHSARSLGVTSLELARSIVESRPTGAPRPGGSNR